MAKQLELDTTILGATGETADIANLTDYSDVEIEALFESAFENYPESEFLESIYVKWQNGGELTVAQWQGLQNSISRTRKNY